MAKDKGKKEYDARLDDQSEEYDAVYAHEVAHGPEKVEEKSDERLAYERRVGLSN